MSILGASGFGSYLAYLQNLICVLGWPLVIFIMICLVTPICWMLFRPKKIKISFDKTFRCHADSELANNQKAKHFRIKVESDVYTNSRAVLSAIWTKNSSEWVEDTRYKERLPLTWEHRREECLGLFPGAPEYLDVFHIREDNSIQPGTLDGKWTIHDQDIFKKDRIRFYVEVLSEHTKPKQIVLEAERGNQWDGIQVKAI